MELKFDLEFRREDGFAHFSGTVNVGMEDMDIEGYVKPTNEREPDDVDYDCVIDFDISEEIMEEYYKWVEVEDIANSSFFLFGSEAVRNYDSIHIGDENSTFLQWAKDNTGEWAIFGYDPKYNDPQDLLAEYDGWMGYMEIPYDVYLKLKDL